MGLSSFLKATEKCQDCKWYEADAYRCLVGGGVDCHWEPKKDE